MYATVTKTWTNARGKVCTMKTTMRAEHVGDLKENETVEYFDRDPNAMEQNLIETLEA